MPPGKSSKVGKIAVGIDRQGQGQESGMREEALPRKIWKMLDLQGPLEGFLYLATVTAFVVLLVVSSGLTDVDEHPVALAVALWLVVVLSVMKGLRKWGVRRILPLLGVAFCVAVLAFLGVHLFGS
jgi:hypothetical protein